MKKRVAIPLAIFIGLVFWFTVLGIIGSKKDPSQRGQQAEQSETVAESVQAQEPEPQQPETVESEPKPALLEPIDPARTDIDPNVIKYDIAALDPGHIGVIKRYTYRVVVYQRLNKVQLALIADTIYRHAQKETPFNALKIIFHDYPQISARLGYVDYAPNGKWVDAGTVKTGNYSKMKMIDHLFEPDWSKAITEQEVNIYTDYTALERQYSEIIEKEIENGTNTTGYNPMERALPDIARRYDMSENEVFRLIMKASQSYEKNP
jgi:hypothetical protein